LRQLPYDTAQAYCRIEDCEFGRFVGSRQSDLAICGFAFPGPDCFNSNADQN